MKIRTRIILLLSSTFVSFILIFGIVIYFLTSNYGFSDFYERLRTRANTTIRIRLEHSGDIKYLQRFKKELLVVLPEEQDFVIELLPNNQLKNQLPIAIKNSFIQKILKRKSAQTRENDVFQYGIFYTTKSGKKYIVITSARNEFYASYTEYLRGLLLVVIGVSIILIISASIWISKRLITPINKMTHDINQIGTENLHIRLNIKEGEQDEFGALVQTMNSLFDRLETSFETQKNFISNASHELNTPLTGIIGEADLMLLRDRTIDEYKSALTSILSEAEKLDKKTKALLFLAQTGYDGKKINFNLLRVDQLIFDTLETIKRIVPAGIVKFDFDSLPELSMNLKVLGNEQLLILALSNVILNGCKYSNNQLVNVWFTPSEKHLSIHIKDSGIGIPAEDMPFIYDPYFRAANTKKFEGYGIGLPLTRNIIRLHNGKLTVFSEENKGTLVTIQLNLAPELD